MNPKEQCVPQSTSEEMPVCPLTEWRQAPPATVRIEDPNLHYPMLKHVLASVTLNIFLEE